MSEPQGTWRLKSKLKIERAKARNLKSQVEKLKDEIEFRDKALGRASRLIEKLDEKDGKLWHWLMTQK